MKIILSLFFVFSIVYCARFEPAQRTICLNDHNGARADVQPPAATPLNDLSYSLSLETVASDYADLCVYQHSTGSGFGENLYAGSGHRTDLDDLIHEADFLWEEEENYYTITLESDSCQEGEQCGHYTQMIWDHESYPTHSVGCGYAFCSTNSPFGSNYPTWTYVVCNYDGPGNYINRLPYVISSSSPPPCSPSCPANSCGMQNSCGQQIDCGDCCTDLCGTNECGAVEDTCGTPVNCGDCNSEETCILNETTNIHNCETIEAECDPSTECSSANYECGNALFCEINFNCGTCTEGECINHECVVATCSCGENFVCEGSNCVCPSGFTLDGSDCVTATTGSEPDYSGDFEQTFPDGDNFIYLSGPPALKLQQSGTHILKWVSTAAVMDKYTSETYLNIHIPSGGFGVGFRHNQGASRENDRFEWRISDIGGGFGGLQICMVYYGNDYCSGSYNIDFPSDPVDIKVTMSFDDANSLITSTWQVGSGSIWSTTVAEQYYTALGGLSYYFSPPSEVFPVMTETAFATSTTLTVSLQECIEDSDWETLFYELTGADPATTSVQVRPDSANANCGKSAKSGKALVSGFTFVATSSSVSAASLATAFTNSIGTPAAAAIGVQSAGVIGGSTGASIAGFPTSAAALPGSIVVPGSAGTGVAAAGGAGGAAGAGGAGSAGLSGGAIAGIVVGSVAGGILALGIAAIVVGAIIVGAVIISQSGDDAEDSSPSDNKRKSVRKTIRGFFGGVDVMNDPGKGHQSISARSPAM